MQRKKILIEVLKAHSYAPDMEDLDAWLKLIDDFNKRDKTPRCPECGRLLETRKFVDSWGPHNEPCDVNEDLYCPKCDVRVSASPGPHTFLETKGGKGNESTSKRTHTK